MENKSCHNPENAYCLMINVNYVLVFYRFRKSSYGHVYRTSNTLLQI